MRMFANPDLKKEDPNNWDRLSTESDYENARELVKSGKVQPPMPFTHKFHKFPTALTNICFKCKEYGHFAKDCTNMKNPIQLCLHCGVPGHARPDCDKLKTGKFILDLFFYKRTHNHNIILSEQKKAPEKDIVYRCTIDPHHPTRGRGQHPTGGRGQHSTGKRTHNHIIFLSEQKKAPEKDTVYRCTIDPHHPTGGRGQHPTGGRGQHPTGGRGQHSTGGRGQHPGRVRGQHSTGGRGQHYSS